MSEEKIDSCIKFSKNSWHYKLVHYLHGPYYFGDWSGLKRISLCKYFWTVVTGLFLLPFLALWRALPERINDHEDLGKAIVIWTLICTAVHVPIWYITGLWWVGLTVFFGGIGAGLGVFGFIIMVEKLHDKWKHYKNKKPYKARKPNLVKEFVKAKKSKVCPCIEFIDEKKDEDLK